MQAETPQLILNVTINKNKVYFDDFIYTYTYIIGLTACKNYILKLILHIVLSIHSTYFSLQIVSGSERHFCAVEGQIQT